MYHTFESTKQTEDAISSQSPKLPEKRPKATPRACLICRKRKIRCDGQKPCGSCQWYRKGSQCNYGAPRLRDSAKRPNPNQLLRRYQGVLQRVFPDVAVDQLVEFSRDELLVIIDGRAPDLVAAQHKQEGDKDVQEDDSRSLEKLQAFPEQTSEALSRPQTPRISNGVTDDVNALSLSVKKPSSYLGVSSVMAVLRIILLLDPDSPAFATSSARRSHANTRQVSEEATESATVISLPPPKMVSFWDEVPAINAYFYNVHPQIPLLDEAEFREFYTRQDRDDSRWKLLLNAVLAMGSMAATTADDKTHAVFYERAREHLVLENFSHAHVETVQALAILSGMYLHYVQQPNLANFMIGASFRMATTLGLHRDYSESISRSVGDNDKSGSLVELRRRLWWCLLMMDGWNANYLGRPTMGRIGPGHTTQKPQDPISGDASTTTLMQESIDFCVISTSMDDLLAQKPVLSTTTRQDLDTAFLSWLEKSSVARSNVSEANLTTFPGLTVARNSMRWRCLSSRIFIYRPILLWYAMQKSPMSRISENKRSAITTCRAIADDLIQDISATWQHPSPCQMAGWSATWHLYQATMVPLLSLFRDSNIPAVVTACRQSVELAIATLSLLGKWSCTAKRSLEVVSRLFDASRAYHHAKVQARPRRSQHSVYRTNHDVVPNDASETTENHQLVAEAGNEEDQEEEEEEEFHPLPNQEDTPSTFLSASVGDEFLIRNFFDDLSWSGNGLDCAMEGLEHDLDFLNYCDVSVGVQGGRV